MGGKSVYSGKTEGGELGFRLLPPPPSPILTHPRQSTIGIEVARFEEGPGRGKKWAGSNASISSLDGAAL